MLFETLPMGRLRGLKPLLPPGEEDQDVLLRIARQVGGGEYLVGLRRYENHPNRDALLRLKEEVDPRGILQAAR
jgi:hypothetical protein